METETTDDGAGDLNKFKEAWHAPQASVTTSTNPPGAGQGTPPEVKGDAASKAAHTNIKKAHKYKNKIIDN